MTRDAAHGAPARRRFRLPAVAVILVGALAGQGLVIAVSPLLTRLHRPEDFGALAVVTAIASVVGAGATLGTDRAVLVAEDADTALALAWVGGGSVAVVGAVSGVVAWAVRERMSAVFETTFLAASWWVLPLTVVAVGAFRLISAFLARNERHRVIGLRNAVQGVGQVAWNIAAAAAGPIGLVGGLAIGRFAAVAGVGLARPRRTSVEAIRRSCAEHRRFLVVTPVSAVANVLGQQAPALVLAAVHGAPAAGFVALTMRVLGAPVGMLADAVAQYAAGALGRRVRGSEPLAGVVAKLVLRLLTAGGVAVVVIVLAGPALFSTVFGPEWEVSGRYAQVLVPAFALQVAVSPVVQLLAMLGRQALQLLWDVGRLAATSLAVLVPSISGAPMLVVVASLAGAMIVAYATMLVLVARTVRSTDVQHVENSTAGSRVP